MILRILSIPLIAFVFCFSLFANGSNISSFGERSLDIGIDKVEKAYMEIMEPMVRKFSYECIGNGKVAIELEIEEGQGLRQVILDKKMEDGQWTTLQSRRFRGREIFRATIRQRSDLETYRLRGIDREGTEFISEDLLIDCGERAQRGSVGVYPTIFENNIVVKAENLSGENIKIWIVDLGGNIQHTQTMFARGSSFTEELYLDGLDKGIYWVHLVLLDRKESFRIVKM